MGLEKLGIVQDGTQIPLRELVYSYLKEQLNAGALRPGVFLDLNRIGNDIGLSRTPLRDALLRLEAEGFVAIHPRRGVLIKPLDLSTIRNAYQLLGALEAAAILEAAQVFDNTDAYRMEALNNTMQQNLASGDFDGYYRVNLLFHDVYLEKSANTELRRLVRILKERLYDFPRREGFLSEWETQSLIEHEALVQRLASGDFVSAAAYIRDVHWSFKVQEQFIMTYYFAREAALGPRL